MLIRRTPRTGGHAVPRLGMDALRGRSLPLSRVKSVHGATVNIKCAGTPSSLLILRSLAAAAGKWIRDVRAAKLPVAVEILFGRRSCFTLWEPAGDTPSACGAPSVTIPRASSRYRHRCGCEAIKVFPPFSARVSWSRRRNTTSPSYLSPRPG